MMLWRGKHIMIARDHDLGGWKRVQKAARCLKLNDPGPLREISGNNDKIRFDPSNRRNQRLEQRPVDASEVQIRQMDYGSHVRNTRY